MQSAGAVLLEVIVALAIFATVGVAGLALAAGAGRAVAEADTREAQIRDASAFLEVVALWPRADLEQRLGDRRQGPWLLRIQRPAQELYVIVLTDSTGQQTILRTSIFRRDSLSNHE